MGESSPILKIDVWADVTCPWCFLGSRRLQRAIVAYSVSEPEVTIEVEEHSFELTPSLPHGYAGSEIDFMVAYEGVPRDRAERTVSALTDIGAAEGIAFQFAQVRHVNTFHLHRLLHFAKARGVQLNMMDRMHAACFTEGANLEDADTLVELSGAFDLSEVSVRELLADDDMLATAVEFDMQRAQMLGITAVPYFLINQKYAVPGAVSESQFIAALTRVQGLLSAS